MFDTLTRTTIPLDDDDDDARTVKVLCRIISARLQMQALDANQAYLGWRKNDALKAANSRALRPLFAELEVDCFSGENFR